MALKTEHRPSPLPPRPGTAAAPAGAWVAGRGPKSPEGAVGWAYAFIDSNRQAQLSPYPVPVDGQGRRTAHILHGCSRGKVEVTVDRENGLPPVKEVRPCDRTEWLLPDAGTRFCPDHGCEMVPRDTPKKPGMPWGKLFDVADERLRVTAATVAVGTLAAVDDQVDLPWWGDIAEWSAVPAVVWSSWWLTRWWLLRRDVKNEKIDPADEVTGKRRRQLADKRARIAAYAMGAAVGFDRLADITNWTSTSGRAVVGMAALAGLSVLCSKPYRDYVDGRRKPAEKPTKPVAADPVAPTMPPGMIAQSKWVEHDPNGAVANTVLLPETWRKVTGGWGIIMRATKPGAISVDMFTGASADKSKLRAIAGTFDLPVRIFNFVEQESPNELLMLVQPNPPLAQAKVWAGPESIDVERGVALTGFYIDGSPVYEPFYKYGWGAPSKIVTGTTGSGKSENLRKQLVIERYFAWRVPDTGEMRGLFASFLHDFKQFESYGEFPRALHAVGCTVEDAYIMRDALIREMHRRYDMLRSYGWVDKKKRRREGGIKWDPRIHGPILSWIIDEFHEIAKDPAFIGPLELLARKMRACGIRVTIGTHLGTLGDTGSRGFRDMLAGGYALLGRTTDSLTSVVTGAQLNADPRQLPKVPGMCLVADGEQTTMQARQSYIPADEDAPVNVYDLLFDDDNNPIGYPAVLPPETLEAFGPGWVEWAEAGMQWGGREPGRFTAETVAAAAGQVTPAAAPAGSDAEAESAKDAIKSILALNPDTEMDIDAVDKALAPFRARGVRCGTRMAREALRQLVDSGFAIKPKHGFYQLNPDRPLDELEAEERETEEADA